MLLLHVVCIFSVHKYLLLSEVPLTKGLVTRLHTNMIVHCTHYRIIAIRIKSTINHHKSTVHLFYRDNYITMQ